jgi:membrane protein required for beta-lactamase induction
MSLLAMLLALSAERLLSERRAAFGGERGRWAARLPGALRDSPALPWLLALGLSFVVGLLGSLLDHALLRLVYGAAVLFACLGPRDLVDDVQRLRAARSAGDSAAVARLTRLLQSGPAPDADHRSLLGALFIQSHERRFGMLLWFLVAGPAGAVLYRIASRLPAALDPGYDEAQARSATLLHALLAWFPARATALLFGLAGSLDDALLAWKRIELEAQAPETDVDWRQHSWALLAEVANAALDWEDSPGGGPMISSSLDATLAEVLRMELRATLILLAIVAVFTAGVWIS